MRRRGNIRFDNPDDPSRASSVCIELCMRLMTLDYARRVFERKDDETSHRRAEELRDYFRKAIDDSVIAIRSLVPDEIISEHSRITVCRAARDEEERREARRKARKLAKLEDGMHSSPFWKGER